MPDEEPEQHPEAAPGPAPAKKAAAKKAPAKKSAAKKSPAKQAAARRAPVKKAMPRATIMNRIQELEERMADEGAAPSPPLVAKPRQASARPVPVEPLDRAEALAPPAVAPVQQPPAVLPAATPPPPPSVLPPALPRATPRRDLGVPPVEPVGAVRRSADRSGFDRALVVLLVLLLSAAAGLGTAAFVKHRKSTWHARAVVAITPPSAGSATESTSDAAVRYLKTAQTREFASEAAQLGSVPGNQVKGPLKATQGQPGEIVLDARASTADLAAALAEAASREMVLAVLKDQAERVDAASRMGARVLVATSRPTRLQPTDRAALIGGALAAVDVLLVAVMVVILLQRPSRRRR